MYDEIWMAEEVWMSSGIWIMADGQGQDRDGKVVDRQVQR